MDLPIFKRRWGQTLVVVLVVLVIAAIVTTAVSYRVIQEIRSSAEERNSALAASQIESLLDIGMGEGFWNDLWADDIDGCAEISTEYTACEINRTFWNDYITTSDVKCDDWSVYARRSSTGISSFFLGKDEVVEIDLRNADGSDRTDPTSINISWVSGAQYLILKFYNDGDVSDSVALTYEDINNWDVPDVSEVYTMPTSSSVYTFSVEDMGYPDVVRIRAVGGDALLEISGLAQNYYQFGELKAYCYIDDVYREYISQFMLRSSVPSVFDYSLYDASGTIGGGM